MSKEYEKPLTLKLHSSAVLYYYLVSVHLLALFAVFYASIPLLIQLLCVGFIVVYYFYLNGKLKPPAKIVWLQENNWQLYDSEITYSEACLTPWSFLTSWVVVLVFKLEAGKKVCVLVPYDALDIEIFRQLKLKLTTLKPKYLRKLSTD